LRADAELVKECEETIEIEKSEEVTQEEKPKKKKISRWRRFLTFLHIRRGYFFVLCICPFFPFVTILSATETAYISSLMHSYVLMRSGLLDWIEKTAL